MSIGKQNIDMKCQQLYADKETIYGNMSLMLAAAGTCDGELKEKYSSRFGTVTLRFEQVRWKIGAAISDVLISTGNRMRRIK